MATARWKRERYDRIADPPETADSSRLEAGALLGVLAWHARDGRVRRWIVRQGARGNRIRIDGVEAEHGWSWLLAALRKKLAGLTRRASVDSTPSTEP